MSYRTPEWLSEYSGKNTVEKGAGYQLSERMKYVYVLYALGTMLSVIAGLNQLASGLCIQAIMHLLVGEDIRAHARNKTEKKYHRNSLKNLLCDIALLISAVLFWRRGFRVAAALCIGTALAHYIAPFTFFHTITSQVALVQFILAPFYMIAYWLKHSMGYELT